MSEESHTKICCNKCNKECTKAEYSKKQWKHQQPTCRLCIEAATSEQQVQTKMRACVQCKNFCYKDQLPKKQWKKKNPLCRLCFELTNISEEQTRQCRECKLVKPRTQYDIYQWGKGDEALCGNCREQVGGQILASLGTMKESNELSDGTVVCSHSLECCDICMMDFTLLNQFARKRTLLGRDLTNDECEDETKAYQVGANIHINRKICIMDGQSWRAKGQVVMCPRSGRKLRCPCDEVTYCSKPCQVHHWAIHKMTCKVQAKKEKAKCRVTLANLGTRE